MIVFDLCGLALVSAYLRKEGITVVMADYLYLQRPFISQSIQRFWAGCLVWFTGKLVVCVLGQA